MANGAAATLGLTKMGAGTLTLSNACTYTGATTVSNGTLLVAGSLASGSAVTVAASGTLSGTGTIGGAVTTDGTGGTLAPGTASTRGTLTINNTLTLLAGSTSALRINKAGAVLTSDLLTGMTGVTYGGTLQVTATGDALASGDKFTLFTKSSGSYGGSFSATNLPTLTGSLVWDTSNLLVDGSIAVLAPGVVAPPTFSPIAGGYAGAQSVTISTVTANATIYYTTDGTDPTTSGTRHSGTTPITGVSVPAPTNMTLRAYAAKLGSTPSAVVPANYVTVTTPVWTTAGGGSWADTNNWLSGVAAGHGCHRGFQPADAGYGPTVTLDGPRTIGNLIFGDQGMATAGR